LKLDHARTLKKGRDAIKTQKSMLQRQAELTGVSPKSKKQSKDEGNLNSKTSFFS
jgi:hypothetical protein